MEIRVGNIIEYKTSKGRGAVFRGKVIEVAAEFYKVQHIDGASKVNRSTPGLGLSSSKEMTSSPRVLEPPPPTPTNMAAARVLSPVAEAAANVARLEISTWRTIDREDRAQFNSMMCAKEDELHISALQAKRAEDHRRNRPFKASVYDWSGEEPRRVTNPWFPELVSEPGRLFIALSINKRSRVGRGIEAFGTEFPNIEINRNLDGPHITLLEIFVHPNHANFGMLMHDLPEFGRRVAGYLNEDFMSCRLHFTGYEDFVKFIGGKFESDTSCFNLFRNSVSLLLLHGADADRTTVQFKTSVAPSPQAFTHYDENNFAIGTFSCVWEPHVSLMKKTALPSCFARFQGKASSEILEALRVLPSSALPTDRPLSFAGSGEEEKSFDYLFVSFNRQKVYIPL
jgi:hypothetical protein